MDRVILSDYKRPGYYIAFAFAFSISILNAKNNLIEGSALLYQLNSSLNILAAVISLIGYGYAIIAKEHRFPLYKKQVGIIFGIFLLWLFTYLLNDQLFTYSYVREEFSEFVIYSLPALLFLPALSDCEDLLDAFYKLRWFMLVVASFSVFLMMRYGQIQGVGTRYSVYSMSFGRTLMLPCVLFLSKWFTSKKSVDLIGAGLCLLYIVVFASRFPLLCVGTFVVWKIFKLPASRWKYAILTFGAIIFGLFFVSFNSIVSILYNFFQQIGINSRSLSLLTHSTFNYDSGRLEIYDELIKVINKSPIFGYGAGGGNVALNNGLSHSFIFDVFANLGYLGGGLFLLISFLDIIRNYKYTRNKSDHEFMMICLSFFVPICVFQMSLWRASYFWMLIALCCGKLRYSGGIQNYG